MGRIPRQRGTEIVKLEELSKGRRFLVIGSVFVAIAILFLLLAEGAVRARSYLKTGLWWGVSETYTFDADSGLRIPRPGLESSRIKINSAGFRGPELPIEKPAGTVRIAFLGGSTTYCAEVSSNEATWPHLVAAALGERYDDVQFEYINAGVPGYSAPISLKNLRTRVAAYQPDIIVVYHATNDLSWHSYQAAESSGIAMKRAEQNRFWLSEYSLLSHLIELNLKILLLRNETVAKPEKLTVDARSLAAPFEADMRALVQAAKSVAPVVAVATFSVQYRRNQTSEVQARAASTSLYYMPYMSVEGLLDSFEAYNAVIRAVADEEAILLIDGEETIPGDSVHFNDSVHFTDAGSAAMAERVTRALTNAPSINVLVENQR